MEIEKYLVTILFVKFIQCTDMKCAFSFGFFFKKNKHVLLWVVGGGGFHDTWDLVFQEILP